MNKKGAEMTISTLVIIVLAIIVLVVLALGFGAGWTNLWSKMTGFFSPVNVDSIKQACVYACTTQAKYDYCDRVRDVTFEVDKKKQTIKETCYGLNKNYPQFSIEECDNVNCEEIDLVIYDDDASAKTKCKDEMDAKNTAAEKAQICASSKRVKKDDTYDIKTCKQVEAQGC